MPSVPPTPGRHCSVAWVSTAVIRWMRERVAAAGGDPSEIPDEPVALWRLPEVERRTGYSRPTIYRLAARDQFPRAVPLSVALPREAA